MRSKKNYLQTWNHGAKYGSEEVAIPYGVQEIQSVEEIGHMFVYVISLTHFARPHRKHQYEIIVKDNNDHDIRTIFYGRLMRILVCHFPKTVFWKAVGGTTRIFALISPFSGTNGQDAAESVGLWKGKYTTRIATDIQTISSVIGLVKTRNHFGICDRSDGLAKMVFVDDDGEEESSTDSDSE